ncbi:MAG: hypothetical protein ACOYMN_14670 [Roseimicrobium sp.]
MKRVRDYGIERGSVKLESRRFGELTPPDTARYAGRMNEKKARHQRQFRDLDPERIKRTLQEFIERISTRFAGSGLHEVSLELGEAATHCSNVAKELRRPLWGLRLAVFLAVAVLISLPLDALLLLDTPLQFDKLSNFPDLMQAVDAGFNLLILLAGAAWFLISVESRFKRRRALRMLDELRSLAHVVDMHQLSKDPAMHIPLIQSHDPELSQEQTIRNAEDLWFYLSFCTDLLSVIGKLAALFAQGQMDRTMLDTVNEIETLSTALARKIWQKLSLVRPPHPALQTPSPRSDT